MRVMYIGKKEVTTDQIFGTGGMWNGYGDVVDIPDATAQLMIRRHPDVYAEASDTVHGVVEERPVAGGGKGNGPVGDDPLDTIFVQDGTENVSLRVASRAALMRHAKVVGYKPRNTATKTDLIEQIVRLTLLAQEAEGGESGIGEDPVVVDPPADPPVDPDPEE